MKNLNALDWTTVAVLVVGGINWGMIGAFDINLVSYLFGDMTILSRAVYALVGLSALYIIGAALFASTEVQSNRIAHT